MKEIVFLADIKMVKNNGQAAIEFVLMMLVVALLASTFYTFYNQQFGRDGDVLSFINQRMRFSYRHAIYGSDDESYNNINYNSGREHKSYAGDGSSTRFFGPNTDTYPAN